MPYDIRQTSKCDGVGLFREYENREDEFLGCHSDKDSAQSQIAAIEQNKGMQDIVITPPFRTLKDLDDKGSYGEYLVVFGNKEEHDLEGDFFTSNTKFWLDIAENKSAVLYGHGMDDVFGKKRLDKDGAQLKVTDEGVWLETQLHKRNKYEEMVHKLAKDGKLGLSSGTATHLVEKEKVSEKSSDTIHEIKQWPLGLDATLTPQPAEPRVGKIRPLSESDNKSIKEFLENSDGDNMEKVSLTERRNIIKSDFRDHIKGIKTQSTPVVKRVYDNHIITKMSGKRFRVPYSGSIEEGHTFAERSNWVEVVKDVRYVARETAKRLDNLNSKIEDKLGSPTKNGSIASQLDSLIERTQ